MNKFNTSNDDKFDDEDNWLDEHGQPSFEYLQSLEKDGSLDAVEKLKSIASDLDVEYSPDIPTEDLIEKIRSAIQDDPNATT